MIATGNAGQGMMPLLQLLGGGSDLKDLQALEGLEGLKDLKTAEGEGFLDILQPQLEALLADLGVGEEELEGLDLEGMLARLQALMDGGELAVEVESGGKDLPLAALMTAVDDRPGPTVARMERGEGNGGAREIKPLPAAVMRLFLESSQGSAASGGGAGTELLGPNSRLRARMFWSCWRNGCPRGLIRKGRRDARNLWPAFCRRMYRLRKAARVHAARCAWTWLGCCSRVVSAS